jgi:exopolysaccharide biosynthesis polyprenyl glycosylphosphotransferase
VSLPQVVIDHAVAELIVAYNNELPGDVFAGMMACYEQGITVVIMPLLYERITGRVPIEHTGQNYWSVVFSVENRPLTQRLYFVIKRLMDIAFAVIGLVAFGVVLAPIALLITLDSPGPVFYRQERVGQGGKCFIIYKLRTMQPDVERETGPRWTTDGDPRRTRVGKVLRMMRLDELPQLLNVLRGEMSMIGPRPERPAFVQQLTEQIPFYRTRLVARPGLTGWAQVCYPYASTAEEALHKLQYDLYYIRHQSVALDVQILLRTLAQVITFQGR